MFLRRSLWLSLLAIIVLTTACRDGAPAPAGQATLPAPDVQATATAAPPTATPTATPIPTPTATPLPPMAAMVNGRPIFLSDYQTELARFEQAQLNLGANGGSLTGHDTLVLDALIERELVLSAAEAAGIVIGDSEIDTRLETVREGAGGAPAFDAWLQANRYTEAEFRTALAAEMVVGAMTDQVTAGVSMAEEQVRASYIQLDDEATAQDVRGRATAGDDFTFLAQQFSVDQLTGQYGGDLGFFPRGGLLVPELEAAAFALQPGEISEVVTVTGDDGVTTHYIITVTERDPARRLTADILHERYSAVYQEWLEGLWASAAIERFTGSESE